MPTDDLLGSLDHRAALVGLACAIVMSQILAWHYIRYAKVLSNKRKFARIFVVIACTTLLMISVVKTSLALSLGLVGALSIIRFRTPIKEPEELAYLFLSIAIGVGLGASQILITAVIFAVVLTFITLRHKGSGAPPVRTILQVSLEAIQSESPSSLLQRLVPAVEESCRMVDVRRVDTRGSRLDASLAIELDGLDALTGVLASVESRFPGAEVSFIERDGLE